MENLKLLRVPTHLGLALCFLQLILLANGASNSTTGFATSEFVTTGLSSSSDAEGKQIWMVYMAVSSVIILSIAMLAAFLIVYALKNTTKYQLEDLERQHALRVRKGLLHPASRDSSRESSPMNSVQSALSSTTSTLTGSNDFERLRTKLMYIAPKDPSYGAFEEDIRVKWNKPLDKMPVAVDLPRLVKVISLFIEGKKVWPTPKEDLEERREKLILSFLTSMGEHFETQATRDSIVANYGLYFHEDEQNVDISRRLGKFLGEVLGEDCKILKVLKVCNQAILAPAVVRMKYYIANDFPYNDVAGGWRINIAVFDEQVRVRHSKWEKSIESESFRFKWEFELAFDIHLKVLLSIDLYISELQFGNADNELRRKKLRQKINETCWGLAPPKDLWEMAM